MPLNTIYPATSPYYNTEVTNANFLDFMTYRPIPKFSSDVLMTITQVYQFRPDLLAYDLYADSRLWWVFSQRNPNVLKDPLFDFTTGTGIYLPKADLLKRLLGL